jgi:allantoin racemase
MADLCASLSAELGVPVVDGVAAATLEVEKLVRLGLRTSKRGELAMPPVKRFA